MADFFFAHSGRLDGLFMYVCPKCLNNKFGDSIKYPFLKLFIFIFVEMGGGDLLP